MRGWSDSEVLVNETDVRRWWDNDGKWVKWASTDHTQVSGAWGDDGMPTTAGYAKKRVNYHDHEG